MRRFFPLLAAVSLLGAAPGPPAFERAIRLSGPGLAAVVLDRGVYEGAEADLRDLRVVDDRGGTVPYRLDRGVPRPAAEWRPRVKNRTFVRGQSETVTLDFGRPARKRRLVLRLSGHNFRRRVAVEGSEDGEGWATLVDGAYVFAVPGPEAARYETVALPENDFPLVRVTIFHAPDDPPRIEIEEVRAPGEEGTLRERPLRLAPTRAEDTTRHETLVTLDLGARHQPFEGLVLDLAEPRFFRGVTVEARRESPPTRSAPGPISWVALGEGAVYRYDDGGRVRECLRLDVRGRERVLRLRIRNRDDRPLELRGVTAMVPEERLVFEAAPGRAYRFTYGTPDLAPPEYDLVRTISDLTAWGAGARPAGLDPPVRISVPAARVPWTERHPALFWVGLLAVVTALGFVTWRALQRAG